MRIFTLLAFVCFSIHATAQKNPEKYARAINSVELQKHLNIIAGEDMQGRETGTEGQRKAAAYIESQFREMGLKMPQGLNGYQQFYPLHRDSMTESKLDLMSMPAAYGIDYIIQANNNENGEFNSRKIIFAGYGIDDPNYSDYSSIDVKGKVVALFLGEPKKDGNFLLTGTDKSSDWNYPGISKKVALAAQKGAVGVLIINPVVATFNERLTETSKKTNLYYPKKNGSNLLNYALISHTLARSILGPNTDTLLWAAKNSVPFETWQLFEKDTETRFKYTKHTTVVEASNVLGIIEGTDKKDEYVFLTAHYDHLGMRDGKIYYGADDDGSGTVSIMQMAKAFMDAKAGGNGPRRTIVVMAVSGEEKGLWGSEYYSDNPVYPLEKTTVDLNIDMIGRVDTERKSADTLNYVYVVGHDKLSSDLQVINESINKKYSGLTLDYKFDDPNDKERIYFRSDHYNFARKGVPVLFFYDGMLKADYHKPSDTVDKINWTLMEKRALMIFHTAWEMANRNEMLKRDIPLPENARRR